MNVENLIKNKSKIIKQLEDSRDEVHDIIIHRLVDEESDGIIKLKNLNIEIASSANEKEDINEKTVYMFCKLIVEPNLRDKELLQAYSCKNEIELARILFTDVEIANCLGIASKHFVGAEKMVEEVKKQ